MNEVPDTTEAIYAKLCETNELDLTNRSLRAVASIANDAFRQALTEAGYVICKPIEVSLRACVKEFWANNTNDNFGKRGCESVLKYLAELGLPIEVIE